METEHRENRDGDTTGDTTKDTSTGDADDRTERQHRN